MKLKEREIRQAVELRGNFCFVVEIISAVHTPWVAFAFHYTGSSSRELHPPYYFRPWIAPGAGLGTEDIAWIAVKLVPGEISTEVEISTFSIKPSCLHIVFLCDLQNYSLLLWLFAFLECLPDKGERSQTNAEENTGAFRASLIWCRHWAGSLLWQFTMRAFTFFRELSFKGTLGRGGGMYEQTLELPLLCSPPRKQV